jgi:hypothetical protein
MSPFLLHFLEHPQARGRCSQGEAGCILGGTRAVREEPGKQKSRSAFLLHPACGTAGAGIWPEAVPRKWIAEKERPTELGRSVRYRPSYVSR